MNDYLPSNDQALLNYASNFVTVATANLAALGLTNADLTAISGGITDMTANLDSINTMKAQIESQYTDKGVNKDIIDQSLRSLVKQLQANPNIADALKTQLGVPIPSGSRSRVMPVTPDTLVAVGASNGVNAIQWNKAANKPTTQYVILAKSITAPGSELSDTGWTMVGQTTSTRFNHVGVVPGQPMAYKVMAARAGFASIPTAPATVYTG